MGEYDELDPQQRSDALKLRASLRAGDELDFITRSKLGAARARALEAASPRRSGWWYAGGLTAAAVLALLLVLPQQRGTDAVPAYDALEVMTDELEPEFYEDLDMYRWLAEDNGNHA